MQVKHINQYTSLPKGQVTQGIGGWGGGGFKLGNSCTAKKILKIVKGEPWISKKKIKHSSVMYYPGLVCEMF